MPPDLALRDKGFVQQVGISRGHLRIAGGATGGPKV
jgi:hypothetical protein